MQEDASLFVEKSKSSKIEQNITFSKNLMAPIDKNAIIGEMTFTIDDEIIKKINIIASDSVRKLNILNMTQRIYRDWFELLR